MAQETARPTTNSTPRLVAVAVIAAVGLLWASAGSDGGARVGGWAVFAIAVGMAYLINWGVYVPSYRAQTEHYYDLTGSATYVSATIVTLLATDTQNARTLVLATLVLVWSLRLGTFLFRRIRKDGKDGRFDRIKTDWVQFLVAWSLQALWVTITAGAAWAAMTSGVEEPFGPWAIIGLAVWVAGFAIEVVADRQKSAFRADPANKGRFINVGLWSWSRHPNYFGEITLWVGVALIAFPVLQGWQYLTLASPLLVAALLIRGSGIPLLERRADKRWGGQDDYEAYKAATSVLIPRPPRRG
jgi:steroid 5-alpha reductase family enzyme